jgi:hypothetical protein
LLQVVQPPHTWTKTPTYITIFLREYIFWHT